MSAATDTAPGGLMAAEIAEQPAVLARLLAVPEALLDVGARIAAAQPRFVLIAARGTSDHAALYAKYLAEVRLELPVGLASPSALTMTHPSRMSHGSAGPSPVARSSAATRRWCSHGAG